MSDRRNLLDPWLYCFLPDPTRCSNNSIPPSKRKYQGWEGSHSTCEKIEGSQFGQSGNNVPLDRDDASLQLCRFVEFKSLCHADGYTDINLGCIGMDADGAFDTGCWTASFASVVEVA